MNGSLERKKEKVLLLYLIGVLTLIAAIVGVTYAFFSATITSGEYITGTSAYKENTLILTINQESAGVGNLIPQRDIAIQSAVTGASGKGSCIDANNNTICKVYSITITNTSNVKLNVNGTLSLSATNMPNLKWTIGSSSTTGFPTPAGTYYTKTDTSLANDTLEASENTGNSKTYYIVIWISELDTSQEDSGDFIGTVTFNGYVETGNGDVQGITSTFRG